MKTRVLLALALLTVAPGAGAQAIVADHAATALASIPDAALPAAANLRLLVRHASVGGNIDGGLDALQGLNAKYDRSKWIFESRGNPGWQAKVDDLVAQAAARASSFDVLTMKLCYIDTGASFTYYRDRMLWLESTYPAKRFVWWTMPIETTSDADRQAFNDAVRTFARANGKVLFDIADIEAYNAAGQKRTDIYGREIMRDEWTSDGGHLSDAGARRVASALWWLMARLGGWDPNGLQVTSISPVSGPVGGGTAVAIKGNGFVAGATVAIGGIAATGVVVGGSTSLTAVTGAHATGLADVTVSTPGPRSATLPQGFFFVPPVTATDFYTITPCRVVDTRSPQSPALAAYERRVFTVTGGDCGVPATATSVSVNVTVTGAAATGNVRLAPGNGLTESSAINFVAGVTRANNAVVMLATDGTGGLSATNRSSGPAHLIVDVNGYFE
ncbi:MAG TPA: IPT/TIG domain-containing protein [Vicinamibacteria bacterium]|nr:IPT/TIG domain-containing protein [Vicinamibacteria bacterium]